MCLRVADGDYGYAAPLGTPESLGRMRKLAFSRWWEQKVFVSITGNLSVSRKNLVFGLRSHDGGAHLDGELTNEAYYRFSRVGDHVSANAARSLTLNAINGKDGKPLPNGHLHTIRQMTWELEQAIATAGI